MLKIFKDQEYKKKLMGLVIPIAIQEALVIFVSTIGVLLLGAVDQNAMSGVSIANNIFFVFNSVVGAVIVGGSLICAQFYGKNDIKSVNKIFYLSLKISIIFSLIFFALSEIIPNQLISIFAPNQTAIIDCGVRYLRLFAMTFIFRAISGVYFYILKNLDKAKQISYASLVALIINVGVSSLSIFVFKQKEYGAVAGIICSRFVEMILSIVLVIKAKSVKFNWKDFLHTDKHLFDEFVKHLVPLFICKLAWAMGSIMISFFLGKLGPDVIAANSLYSIARNIVICIPSGAGGGAAVLLGQELGSNKIESAKEHSKEILKFNIIVGILNMAIFMAVSGICLLISNNSLTSEAQKYLLYMSLIYTPSLFLQAYNAVLIDGVYSSGGDTIFISLANSLPYWVVVVPLGFLSTYLNWHPLVIFFLATSEEIVKNIPVVLRYKSYKWARNITSEAK